MLKKIVTTTFVSLLLTTVTYANNSDPFGSVFQNDPFFQDFQKLQSDMDKLFETFHKRAFTNMPKVDSSFGDSFTMKLKTDVVDKDKYYEVIADLPDMNSSDIKVKAEKGILSIKAESKKNKEEKKDGKIIHQERFVGSLYRSMTLPKDANESNITTEYKDGVLRVKIAKKSK